MRNFLLILFLTPLLFSCQKKYNKEPYDEREEKLRKYPDTISHLLIDSLWQKRDSLTYLRFKNVKQITIIESDSIPNWITDLKNIEILYVSNYKKKIRFLPKNISKLSNLVQIDIPNNNLTNLPESFFKLKNVERLNFNNNSLKYLPNEIINFRNLKVLLVEGNNLDNLPSDICMLKKIKRLTINNTNIKSLPSCISENSSIESIAMNYTKLSQIPINILELPNLKTVSAKGLKLTNYQEVKAICEKRNITFYYDER